MIQLNDKTFGPNLSSVPRILVMFSAPWAGPCTIAEKTLENASAKIETNTEVAVFNLDDNPTVPQKYGIRMVPCFILFQDGEPVTMKAGAISENVLVEMCDG